MWFFTFGSDRMRNILINLKTSTVLSVVNYVTQKPKYEAFLKIKSNYTAFTNNFTFKYV